MKKKLPFIIIFFVGLLIGLTFHISWAFPNNETKGHFVIHQKAIDIGYYCTFSNEHSLEWDVYRPSKISDNDWRFR